MLLPPEVLLHTGPKAAQCIVAVHNHVYNGVDQSTPYRCTGGGAHHYKSCDDHMSYLHCPPATHLMPIHHKKNIEAWW